VNTLEWLRKIGTQRSRLAADLATLRERIFAQSKEIHDHLMQQSRQVAVLFEPVTRYVAEHDSLGSTGLEFSVSLEVDRGIAQLRDAIDRRRSLSVLSVIDRFPVSEPANWGALCAEMEQIFEYEVGSAERPSDPTDDFKLGYSARQFLQQLLDLSWVRLRFGLLSNGVSLAAMSPGQRGLILLLFYLLVDRGRAPLLLDQPEENLDNDTVAAVVVPALRETAARRQVIVVTHNANLAVVGDADQIIRCRFMDGEFSFESGPISAFEIARHAVTVLEGTKPALSNRWNKFRDIDE
jgi:hypothetical protein